ncbi:MAG: hypothetical protein E7028_06725 [Planctomycetaceae bacterium]|nr:hypothetical protein [Planctomycetaceae bacterium]MBQ2821614.1 hypothetical protein [Thermoguttaceae bacterium]MDO4425010.1 hypothetical protein [Planctomycetia bacterium]
MAISLETRISSEIGWNWQDTTPGSEDSAAEILASHTKTQGQFRKQLSVSTQSDPSVNAVWFTENALIPPFTSVTHDLSRMILRLYGTDIFVRFASLCSIYLFNRSETLPLVIANTGSTTASNILSSSFLSIIVPPGGFFTLCNPKADWVITPERNELQLQNAFASEIHYDLFLNGCQINE